MNGIRTFVIATIAVFGVGTAAFTINATAEGMSKIDKKKLVGSWMLVAINNTSPDGKTRQTFGPNDGFLVFDANGRYVQALIRPDLPKFTSSDRNAGTAEENKAVVAGSLASYGTYAMSKDNTITLRAERSTFANRNGADSKRKIIVLTATEMKWENPSSTVGGTSEVAWKRIK